MRKHYLDNARYFMIVLVLVYHLTDPYFEFIYTDDVLGLYPVSGFTFFANPWGMPVMYLISGACACFSLQKLRNAQTLKPFFRSRAQGLLLPAVGYTVLLSWIQLVISFVLTDNEFPAFHADPETLGLYFVMFTGSMWFCFELFLYCVILSLVFRADKKDLLRRAGGKPWTYLIALALVLLIPEASFPADASRSFFCNMVFFFAGYAVFSHDTTEALMKKYWYLLTFPALALGIYITWKNFRTVDYAATWVEKVYAWLAAPAILSVFIRFFNKRTRFTAYMQTHAFPFFVLYLPVLYIGGYVTTELLGVPAGYLRYAVITAFLIVLLPTLTFLLRKIPGLRFILFRDKGPKKTKEA